MKHFLLLTFLCLSPAVSPRLAALDFGEPPFRTTLGLLYSGSWEDSRMLRNRADLSLGLAGPGLLLRARFLDRRPLDFRKETTGEDFSDKGIGGFSFGLYHAGTGSRLLYGVLDEAGLARRLRAPAGRSLPYAENRRSGPADLRTEASATGNPAAYMYLASPNLPVAGIAFRGFASAALSPTEGIGPEFSGGLRASSGRNSLHLEGFATGGKLPAKEGSAWFGDRPPLPEREFRLAGAAMGITSPGFLFAADLAYSSAFAHGSGLYGNAATRFAPRIGGGNRRPWSLSLAAELAEERFLGRDGAFAGPLFRTAGKLERRGTRGSLFRAENGLRAPAFGEPFDRSSGEISHRFGSPSGTDASGFPLGPDRISLKATRNASNPAKVQDSLAPTLGLSLRLPELALPPALLPPTRGKVPAARAYPLGISLSPVLKWQGPVDGVPSPFPFVGALGPLESLKLGTELLWSPGILRFRARWAFMPYPEEEDALEFSFGISARFRRARLGAKASWKDFPEKPEYTLSWRLEF
ncbi:MAG: hypothetical protein FWD94_02065 [Treponema sp.]|nr:hypothetical protein [Treponema sp.]